MSYTVRELREKLDDKLASLGIDPKFRANPAYAAVLDGIDSLIGQMNMSEDADKVIVTDNLGSISFTWTSSTGEEYSMDITTIGAQKIRCVQTDRKKPFYGTNGQLIKSVDAVEQVATLEDSGFITLTTNGAMADNIDCEPQKSNNTTWAERKYYTSGGVMRDREYKGYATGELNEGIDQVRPGSMLYIPNQAFSNSFWANRYDKRSFLIRDKLDTARYAAEDKTKGISYSAVAPLNQEHGLRDMYLVGGDSYPEEVVIPPLTTEEIEAMLNNEPDPRVREALRAYAYGRESYSYSSLDDSKFRREGFEQNEDMSR